jgi:hypothetical protein
MNTKLLDGSTPGERLARELFISIHNPYRNVSQAAMRTRNPFWRSQKQTLLRLVLLPTPLTPTKVIVNGARLAVDGRGVDIFALMDCRMSVEVLGVNIWAMETDKASLTADVTASGG